MPSAAGVVQAATAPPVDQTRRRHEPGGAEPVVVAERRHIGPAARTASSSVAAPARDDLAPSTLIGAGPRRHRQSSSSATRSGCAAQGTPRPKAHRLAALHHPSSVSSRAVSAGSRPASSRPRACRPGRERRLRSSRRRRTATCAAELAPGRRASSTATSCRGRDRRPLAPAPRSQRHVERRRAEEAAERAADLLERSGRPSRSPPPSSSTSRAQRRAELDLVRAGPGEALAERDELRPGSAGVPAARRPRHRRPTIHGTAASVSTLLTAVGRPSSPCSVGYGGRARRATAQPSSEWISEVSSPATYEPAPSRRPRRRSRRRAEEVAAEVARRARLGDRARSAPRPAGTPSARTRSRAWHRRRGRRAPALQHPVGVALHQQPVGERPRVALVPVGDDVARSITVGAAATAPHLRAAGKPAPPRPRRPEAATSRRTRSASAAQHRRPPDAQAPGRSTPASTIGSGTRRDRRRRIAGLGLAGELVGQVGTRAGLLAVQGRRAAVAVAEAVHRLQRHRAVLRARPRRNPQRRLHLGQMSAAAAGHEASRSGAHPHVPIPAGGVQIGEVGLPAVRGRLR